MKLIAFAVPFFLISIALEYFISKKREACLYKLDDFTNNLSCGILEQTLTLPLQGILIFNYNLIYHQIGFINITSNSILAWILLWLGVDFCYYWFHRACHRCNFLWAGHSVHHQSQQFNFSVALRQGVLQTLCSWVAYLPLAVIGFPTEMLLIVVSLNTFYQFWIHTKTIDKIGWFEKIFNTPSHHRVHHGKNACYIDKNYAGSLIIWDKIFHTWEPETIPVEYGTTEPLTSWNPFYANIKVFCDTYRVSKPLNQLTRLKAFFMPPEWVLLKLEESKLKPFAPLISNKVQNYSSVYILYNVLILIGGFSFFLFINHQIDWINIFYLLFIFLTLFLLGGVLNNISSFPLALEIIRSVIIFTIFQIYFQKLFISLTLCVLFFFINRSLFDKKFLKFVIHFFQLRRSS